MDTLRTAFALAVSAAFAMLAAPAAAQTLEIAPITVELQAGRQAGTIRVTNRGDQPTTVQVRPFAWSQPGGAEQLDPTSDLLVSPPFSTLKPGEAQTVRLVLRKPAVAKESTFRLLVDQLPPAADPGSVQVALRISLPVFASPVGQLRPALGWRLDGADPVKRTLYVSNTGTRRARISDLKLAGAGVTATAPGFTFRYVLAGSEIAIPVELKRAGGALPAALQVTATTDQGKVTADVAAAPAG